MLYICTQGPPSILACKSLVGRVEYAGPDCLLLKGLLGAILSQQELGLAPVSLSQV